MEEAVNSSDSHTIVNGEPNTDVANEPIDLEDGELSDEEENDNSTQDVPSIDETNESQSQTTLASSSATNPEESESLTTAAQDTAPAGGPSPSRKSSESSDNNDDSATGAQVDKSKSSKQDDSSDSSSSSDEDRSDRKRKRKHEKRRKKEKKREKRKREKQKERDERKKRRKYHHDEYSRHGDNYGDEYDAYYDSVAAGMTSPRHHRHQRSGYDRGDYYGYDHSPPGPYDSPPPDDSSDDEYSEALYDMVQSELSDPNVSVSDREALFRKSQKKMPGLTQAKLNKIMKRKQWAESNSMHSRSSKRQSSSRRMREEEPKQKCKFYAEGKCQKGDKCQYSHNFIPAKKMEACKFFLQGYCAKGDMCIYLHSEVPCKYYHTRQQCFNADKCKFSHDPLTDSTRPLLEKAILLEETGTFKPEKPSLLGSPPRDIIASYANRFSSSNTELDNVEENVDSSFPDNAMDDDNEDMSNRPIPSIFDLSLKPTADMKEKLDAGLYDEITAPISEGDEEDQYGSPVKMSQSFYADTLASPTKPSKGQIFSAEMGTGKSPANPHRKNRWGPDLPTTNSEAMTTESDNVKKGPLLPLPTLPTPFSNNTSQLNNPNTFSAPTTEANDLSKAAVNLSKIITALRSTSQGAAIVKTSDPRLSTTVTDPRVKVADPRSQDPRLAATSDPRMSVSTTASSSAPRTALLPDPRNPEPAGLLQDPRQSKLIPSRHSPPQLLDQQTALARRPVPEINGIPTKPMDYHLRLVTVESKGVYIPEGADSSQEMLKDPRIRKRIQAMKQGERHAPPSLPDITADLHRMQNALIMSNSAPIKPSNNCVPAASTTPTDPRRLSSENPVNPAPPAPVKRTNSSNPAKMTLSRIQQTLALHSSNNTNSYNAGNSSSIDDEEDGNSLTIDVPDESRNGSNLTTPCS